MMDGIRQYILSVAAAAILCGIIRDLQPEKGTTASLIKLVSGIFLSFVVITPVKDMQIMELSEYIAAFSAEGDLLASQGEDMSADAMASIIKDRTEAYILDKAGSLAADLTVNVELTDDPVPVPVSVQLSGSVSPYARSLLETMIETELGIAKEDQSWIG